MRQILLNAKNCGGRGVRLRLLTTPERRAIFESAAKDVGQEGTVAQLRAIEDRDGVCAMVAEITVKDGYKKCADLVAADVVWRKMTMAAMTDEHTSLFGSKDFGALVAIFHAIHDVKESEVDDILGEAQEVAEA